jgi:hypothetical protein
MSLQMLLRDVSDSFLCLPRFKLLVRESRDKKVDIKWK